MVPAFSSRVAATRSRKPAVCSTSETAAPDEHVPGVAQVVDQAVDQLLEPHPRSEIGVVHRFDFGQQRLGVVGGIERVRRRVLLDAFGDRRLDRLQHAAVSLGIVGREYGAARVGVDRNASDHQAHLARERNRLIDLQAANRRHEALVLRR